MKWLIYLLITFALLMLMGNISAQELTAAEAEDLAYAREEEKLARDVYLAFYQQYDHHVFDHIAASEQRHMDKIKSLLSAFNLPDPIEQTQDEKGKFIHTELQTTYDDMLQKGMSSRTEALKIGAGIEEMDIRDLMEQIERTENMRIKSTYRKLLAASHRHLQAFARNLEKEGISYQPAMISPALYEEILAEEKSCKGGCGEMKGKGEGKHKRHGKAASTESEQRRCCNGSF